MTADDHAKQRVDAWTQELRPRGPVQTLLAELAAGLACKLEHLRKVEAARTAHHRRNAPAAEADRAHGEVIRIGHELIDPATDEWVNNHMEWAGRGMGRPNPNPPPMPPEQAVHLLQVTAGGCRWVAGNWDELSAILGEGLAWRMADERRAIRLLGRTPDAEEDAEVRALRKAAEVARRAASPQYGTMTGPPRGERARAEPTPEEAVATLEGICSRAADRLRRLAIEREEAARPGDEDEEGLRHAFDGSESGKELRRQQSTAQRELLKSLETLMKLKKQPEQDEQPSSGPATTRADSSKASDDGPRPVHRKRGAAGRVAFRPNVRAAGVSDRSLEPIVAQRTPTGSPARKACSARHEESASTSRLGTSVEDRRAEHAPRSSDCIGAAGVSDRSNSINPSRTLGAPKARLRRKQRQAESRVCTDPCPPHDSTPREAGKPPSATG